VFFFKIKQMSQSGIMGARFGSFVVLVLLIGVAQFCQASRDSGSEVTETVNTPVNKTTATVTQKGASEDFETDDGLDASGHVKFAGHEQEGVLAAAPTPSSAFSVLPSFVTPVLALSVAVLAAKAL
jgi:hypothetical protein